MKLNLAAGAHPLDGFENLDPTYDPPWMFEDGLPYPDGSIEAITESHGLMFVDLEKWGFVFAEFARVLEPGGVVRVTEDSTLDRRSERYGGFHDAVTLTSPELVTSYLLGAGLEAQTVADGYTLFEDMSLCQAWHGRAPKVFFVEGIKR